MRPCLNNFYYLQYTTQVFNALILLEGVWFLQRLSADHTIEVCNIQHCFGLKQLFFVLI